jgi:hypothetical protein
LPGRIANVRSCFERNPKRFFDVFRGDDVQDHSCAIVGGGPSLKKTLSQVRKFHGKLFACGSAHDFLRKNGIVPDYAANLDPDVRMPEFFTDPHIDTTYLVASTSDPALFDHLDGWNVLVWHAAGEAPWPELRGEDAIAGGTTIATRTWMIAYLMGYREFHFFGVDSCFPSMQEQHADDSYPENDRYNHHFKIRIDGSNAEFMSSAQMLQQARDFMQFYCWATDKARGCKVHVKGASLTREYVNVYERNRPKWEQATIEKAKADAVSLSQSIQKGMDF